MILNSSPGITNLRAPLRNPILLPNEHYVYLEQSDAERKSVGSFWENLGHESVKEHFMDNYLKNIQSKLDESIQVPYADRETYIKAAGTAA